MISTTTMIKLGKVYGNLMVDLMIVNQKLMDRGIRIVSQLTGVKNNKAKRVLKEADNSVKKAIIMIKKKCTLKEAEFLLKNKEGFLRKVLKDN